MYDTRESNAISGKSVAAFLFMPQFRECFKGFHHIYPIFMRCIALMFVQSKLLPDDHPAIYYGADGVQRTTLRDLFGEAWFILKTTRATTFQYGMFAGIVMMIVTLIGAIVTIGLKIFFGIGDFAQAQIFSHPCDPYAGCTGGPGATDITTMSTALGGGAGGLFDSRVSGAGIPTDYALMVLDKILRQAAAGTPGKGGALQNALTNLMQVYNSGVLLVAGAIMFWMVLSIVIDSAKTGMFGGGRHNMVWTPIRVVFALGIMIPLGNQGFSSGQYAVMKLAEWGSNFGSQGWTAYVAGVLADDSLLSPFSGSNMTSITSGLMKVMTCQVAYNTYLTEEKITDQRQWIVVEIEKNPRDMWVTNRYTNTTGSNVCGTIKYGSDDLSGEDKNKMITAAAAGRTTPMDATSAASVTATSIAEHTNFKAGLQTAIANFRAKMIGALAPLMQENPNMGTFSATRSRSGGSLSAPGGGAVNLARQIACQFVAARFGQPGQTNNPTGRIPNPINHCSAAVSTAVTTPAANAQDATNPQQLLDMMMDQVVNVYDGSSGVAAAPGSVAPGGTAGSAKNELYTYITGPTGMMAEMKRRGWAGMGMWYLDIAQLNQALQAAREPIVTVEAGSVWSGSKGGILSSIWNGLKCAGRWLMGNACRNANLEEKITTVMTDYDRWWGEVTRPGTTGRTTRPTAQRDAEMNPSNSSSIGAVIDLINNLTSSENDGFINWLVERIWPRAEDGFLLNAVDVAGSDTYPLASLTNAGHKIIWISLGIFMALTFWQVLFCAEAAGFSAGCGAAVSAFANGMSTIATTMLVSGLMIAFYLPVLPFIRVAFAVLTWMVSVFEAVVMVPIAALAHLTTEGDGLTGGSARTAWILWLNVLMRPILVVFGFVGGMLIFNTFAVYFHASFSQGAAAVIGANSNPIMAVIGQFAYTVIYLGTLYTAANSSFKMMDLLPNALMRWMGGSVDHSMDGDSDTTMLAAAQLLGNMAPRFDMGGKKKKAPGKDAGVSNGV